MAALIELLVIAAATREAVPAYQIRAELDAIRRAHPGDPDESCIQYLCGRISWRK